MTKKENERKRNKTRRSNNLVTGVPEREKKREELSQESKGLLRIFHKFLKRKKTRSDTKNQESGWLWILNSQSNLICHRKQEDSRALTSTSE